MDAREKLVELLVEFVEVDVWDNGEFIEKDIDFGKIAENLIAHGVTVQEWISVNDRLPEKWQDIIAYDAKNQEIHFACMTEDVWFGVRMNGKVTHWMPLPQPPKGE